MTARWFRAFAGPLLGAILLLPACTSVQRAVVGQGVEKLRQAKDAEAEALKASVCAISIGAYHRVNNATERRAFGELFGGS